MCYAPEELPCEGINFMWNQHNFWANSQQADDGQLATPAATDWNLANPNAWEALVPTASQVRFLSSHYLLSLASCPLLLLAPESAH